MISAQRFGCTCPELKFPSRYCCGFLNADNGSSKEVISFTWRITKKILAHQLCRFCGLYHRLYSLRGPKQKRLEMKMNTGLRESKTCDFHPRYLFGNVAPKHINSVDWMPWLSRSSVPLSVRAQNFKRPSETIVEPQEQFILVLNQCFLLFSGVECHHIRFTIKYCRQSSLVGRFVRGLKPSLYREDNAQNHTRE